jgi:phytoene synthase
VGIVRQQHVGLWAAADRVVERLLGVADDLYARAGAGIDGLPWRCRPAIQAARLLYAGIGGEVARRGFDSVTARAVVPPRRKAALIARAVRDACRPKPATGELPPVPAAAFLLDAVADDPRTGHFDPSHAVRWWHLGTRWGGILNLVSDPARRRPPVEPVDKDAGLEVTAVASAEEQSA